MSSSISPWFPAVATVPASDQPPPPPLRAPFGWPVLTLPETGAALTLRWPANATNAAGAGAAGGGWLRVTTSVDDREEKRVTVRLAVSGAPLGVLDLRHAHSLEPWQLRLDAAAFAAAQREGVTLALAPGATRPLWLLAPGLPEGAAALAPHLLPDRPEAGPLPAFFDRLGSLASVQTFGWMEGCVLDALHDLAVATGEPRWRRALDEHFALFRGPDGGLVYENPRGHPVDGAVYGIEGTLPFAILAKHDPQHPWLDLALAFWRDHLNADGTFHQAETYTAEGSYTVAYPLAVLAGQRRDPALAALSAGALRARRQSLRQPDGLWLRHHPDDTRTFRSWARGVAWYLLGLGRSLEHLAGLIDVADLQTEFRAAAAWALGWQRADGLWGCFLDDPATGADTSGSAGIAAALARGARAGLLGSEARAAADRTWDGLQPHLTPDGFLDGAAQSNRGGEPLQRATYRVLSPMGMGLVGQLAAARLKTRDRVD